MDYAMKGRGKVFFRGEASPIVEYDRTIRKGGKRAMRLRSEIAGLTVTDIDDDLAEWRYGDYEGATSEQIRTTDPDWDLWRDGCPGGERPDEVGARLDRVLAKARRLLPRGDVVLVAHGHSLRVATARWLGQPVAAGAHYLLDTATISAFDFEHDVPVLHRWNERPADRR